jgi:hypothetical protein
MVVTDDDHLLLCDHSFANGKLVTVYYPSGKYMKRIDTSDLPWDIAIIPRTHRAVVALTNNMIQLQIAKGSLTPSPSFNTTQSTVPSECSRCMVFVPYPAT